MILAYAGTSLCHLGGATEQEVNEGYKSLTALLGTIDPSVSMSIANSIWYRNDFAFLQSFLDIGRQYFDAEVRGLNSRDEAGSISAINGWASAKTNGKIPEIIKGISPESVSCSTPSTLKAIGVSSSTRAGRRFAPFYSLGGTIQSVSLPNRRAEMSYAESETYEAVDLPYGNSAFTMTVVLPKPNMDIETFAASLTPDSWRSLTSALRNREVELFLPKLKLSYERTLNEYLKALGMNVAFEPGLADFTRMSPAGRGLNLKMVKQKTYVDIDEEGTEAAAVTVVEVVTVCGGCPEDLKIMRVDRPYIFAIRERLSGTIIFIGKIDRMP